MVTTAIDWPRAKIVDEALQDLAREVPNLNEQGMLELAERQRQKSILITALAGAIYRKPVTEDSDGDQSQPPAECESANGSADIQGNSGDPDGAGDADQQEDGAVPRASSTQEAIHPSDRCLTPGCDRVSDGGRGLCRRCYGRAAYQVKNNGKSWSEFHARDQAKPQGETPWRKPVNPDAAQKAREREAKEKEDRKATARENSLEVKVAKYIQLHGPRSLRVLAGVFAVPWEAMHKKLREHEWFEQQSDGLHLTHIGRTAIGGKDDDD